MELFSEAAGRALAPRAASAPTPRSICGVVPAPNSERPVPASIRKLIGELGLRYRPTRSTDLEAHAAALALLARDLADVAPIALANAIEQWARSSAFMPKASELLALMHTHAANGTGRALAPGELAARMNARLAATGNPRGLRWHGEGEDLRLTRER